MMVKCFLFLDPGLTISTSTLVPLGPLSNLITLSFVIPTPATTVVSTFTIRSPAIIPNLSEGPLTIGDITIMVSSIIRNSTPIPSKLPSKGSFIPSKSLAGI